MKNNKVFLFFCIFVFGGYFIYGLFYADIPPPKADDMWEISRAHFLVKHHHQGDPMYPIEISPYMASLYTATAGSEFIGILKTVSQAFFIYLLPVDDFLAFRITSFAWSLLVCFLTYKIAIKFGLNKKTSFFSVILLIIVPDYFSQVHSQRPELMITALYLAGLMFFIYSLEIENSWKKKILLFFCGIYGWVIVITFHPNAIMIPATFGCIYLLREYKKIFSLQTFLFATGLLGGCIYFYHLMNSAAARSVLEGGNDLLDVTGPPLFRRGIKTLLSLPVIFYKKFSSHNIFARPFSLLFFLTSCISFYYLFRKKNSSPCYRYHDILFTGILIPLLILLLFSASNGHFNTIVFPLCAVLNAAALFEFSSSLQEKNILIFILPGIMLLIFLSDFIGLRKNIQFSKEFRRIRSEIKKNITDPAATIIGSSLFYLDFKDQPYYSNSGMNPRIGRSDQSFEQAVSSVNSKYLIVDDGLVYRIYRGRGKSWTDSMFVFIDKKCELIKEISSNYRLGRSRGIESFPAQWRYEGQNGSYLRKIKIYRVTRS